MRRISGIFCRFALAVAVMFGVQLTAVVAASAGTVSGHITLGDMPSLPAGARTFVSLQDEHGQARYGTSIPAGGEGTYVIRGVRDGLYSLHAYTDAAGKGNRTVFSAYGNEPGIAVSPGSPSVTADLVLLPPVMAPQPQPPSFVGAIPAGGAVLLMWEPSTTENGNAATAESFNVYWSTDENFSVIAGSRTGIPAGGDNNVLVLPGPFAGTWHFAVKGVGGGVESVQATVTSATFGGTASGASITGRVLLPSGTVGSVFVAALWEDPATGDENVFPAVAAVDSETSSASFAVHGLPAGEYRIAGFADRNGNGLIDDGDLQVDENAAPVIAVSGGETFVAPDITFSTESVSARIATSHYRERDRDSYNVDFRLRGATRQPVTVTLVPPGEGEPQYIDLARTEWGEYEYWMYREQNPSGETYSAILGYADGVQPATETITRQVPAVLDTFATPLAPIGYVTGDSVTTPVFQWAPPNPPPASPYTYELWVGNEHGNWGVWGLPSSVTSIPYNSNGTAAQQSLTLGNRYWWSISVRDAEGNVAQYGTGFTPSDPSSLPAVSGISPASGPGNAMVTVSGANLSYGAGIEVKLDGQPVSWYIPSATELRVDIPYGAAPGIRKITVSLDGAVLGTFDYEVVYPTASAISPSSGTPGTAVTLTGTGFTPEGMMEVTYDGQQLWWNVLSPTQIQVNIPYDSPAKTGKLVLKAQGVTLGSFDFTVMSPASPEWSGPVSFGVASEGAVIKRTAYFLNKGGMPLTGTIGLTGSPNFIITGGTCPAGSTVTLALNQSCTVEVSFTAPANGISATGTLSFFWTGNYPLNIPLSGDGGTGSPFVEADPTYMSYPETLKGTSLTKTVTFRNTGSGPDTGTISLSGNSAFAISEATCGTVQPIGLISASIAPGASCAVSVTFTAGDTKYAFADLAFSGASQAVASLTGTSIIPPPPLQVSPGYTSFSGVVTGMSSTREVTLNNTGSVSATGTISLSGSPAFSLSGGTCGAVQSGTIPATIAAGGSCTVVVTFAPGAAGDQFGTLKFTSGATIVTAGVNGFGVSGTPDVQMASGPYDFGVVKVGAVSGVAGVNILNGGNGPLTIYSWSINGDGAFHAEPGASWGCPQSGTLPPGQSCTIAATFSPSGTGYREATLNVSTNDPDTPQKQLLLKGMGENPAEPPTINHLFPPKNSGGVSQLGPVVVNFNTAIDSSSVTAETFKVADASGKPATGIRKTDRDAIFFIADPPLPAGVYTASVTGGIRSTAGLSLPAGETWNFTVVATGSTFVAALQGDGVYSAGHDGEDGVARYESVNLAGTSLSALRYLFNPSTGLWEQTAEQPEKDYTLTETGWSKVSDGPEAGDVVVNGDGSFTWTNRTDSSQRVITAWEFDLAGAPVSDYIDPSSFPLDHQTTFPAGARGYFLKEKVVTDLYRVSVWDDNGTSQDGNRVTYHDNAGDHVVTSLTELKSIFAAVQGNQYRLWLNDAQVQFAPNGELVIQGQQEKGAWEERTVKGQKLLVTSIIEDDGRIFFTVVDGVVKRGEYIAAGTDEFEDRLMFNKTAFNALKASFLPGYPVAVLSGVPSALTTATSASITVGGNGAAYYRYSLDSSDYHGPYPVSSPIAVAGLGDGTHAIAVVTGDSANEGKWQPVPAATTASWVVDATPPASPVIASPATGVTGNRYPTVSGTAEAKAVVTVFDGTSEIATATADNGGAWSVTLPNALDEGAHLLTAKASDAAGNRSQASSPVTVTIDTAAPAAPVISSPASGSVTKNATITFGGTAEGGADVKLYEGETLLGSGKAGLAAPSWSITVQGLADGSHTVTAKAVDPAGNAGASSSAVTFTVDTKAPAAPVITVPMTGTLLTVAKPVISGTAEASSTVTVYAGNTVIGTTTADATGAWTLTPAAALADASWSLTAKATDAAGNTGTASAATAITIDALPPSPPVITVPSAGAVLNTARPLVSGTAEAGAVVTVFDGAVPVGTATAGQAGAWSVEVNPVASGSHTLTAKAKDADGDISSASAGVAITIDILPPAAPVITAPAAGAVITTKSPTLTGTAEAGATVTISDSGSVIGTATAGVSGAWTLALSALSEGAHTFTAEATDQSGNKGKASAGVSVTIDSIPPAIPSITAPSGGATVNAARPPISGTGEAGTFITVYDGSSVIGTSTVTAAGTWMLVPAADLAAGVHGFTAKAADRAGNTSALSSAVSVTVTIPPAEPTVAAVSGVPTGITNRTSFSFTVSTAKGTGVVEYRYSVDGAAVTTPAAVATPIALVNIGEGTHTLLVYGKDSAGVWQASPTVATWTVDLTPPSAAVVTGAPYGAVVGAVKNQALTIRIAGRAGDDAVAYKYTYDTNVYTNKEAGYPIDSPIATIKLTEGSHTLSVWVRDRAGNWQANPTVLTWQVDLTPPTAVLAGAPLANAILNATTLNISVGGAGVAGYRYKLDYDLDYGPVFPADTPLVAAGIREGKRTLSVIAVDSAGNWSKKATAVKWSVAPLTVAVAKATATTTTYTLTGKVEPGAYVSVKTDTAASDGAAVVTGNDWSYTITGIAKGTTIATVTATGPAGNVTTRVVTITKK